MPGPTVPQMVPSATFTAQVIHVFVVFLGNYSTKVIACNVIYLHCFLLFVFLKSFFLVYLLPIFFSAKYSEYKPSWPPEPIGQNKLWRTNRNSSQLPRPPPGLTNPKQTLSSPWSSGVPQLGRNWGGAGINQDSRFGPGK